MKKLGEGGQFEPAWSHYLCEYMMTQQTPVVRRQVRKLLLFICGHKDRYRQMRDMHALDYHIKVSAYTSTAKAGVTLGSFPSPIGGLQHMCWDYLTHSTSDPTHFVHRSGGKTVGSTHHKACSVCKQTPVDAFIHSLYFISFDWEHKTTLSTTGRINFSSSNQFGIRLNLMLANN